MAIRRLSLREQVRDELVGWLASGRLAPGQRLEEEKLSRALGVSRTPVREALTSLVADGLVVAEAHRGFRVPGLSADRVRDLFPVAGALEALALRLSGHGAQALAAPLREINAHLAAEHLSPRQRQELDRRWHATLVSRNPNREAAALLERVRDRLAPYGGSWEGPAAEVEASRSEHERIAELLGSGRVEEAAEAVLRHWVRAARPVAAWAERAGET
ncbi:MAG: GntR family transcriptional regulator [Gammaproteobacteria bacterium]